MGDPGAGLLLSITVPVYNGEAFVPSCLGSIAAAVDRLDPASRAQVEVILCDNHSTDRTAALAEEHAPGCSYRIVRPPVHHENRTRNWHHGLSEARAPWMMMLHADDQLAPDGLVGMLRACRKQQDGTAALILGRHRTFHEGGPPGRPRPAWPMPALIPGARLRRQVLAYHCALVPFTVMRRSAYERIGGLNDRYELLQDWELWLRMLGQGDLYHTPVDFGRWRTHGFSDKYATLMAREVLMLAGEARRLIPDLSQRRRPALMAAYAARARVLLPEHVPPETIADAGLPEGIAALPTRPEAEATMARVLRFVRGQMLRAWLAGTLSRPAAPAR